MTQTILDAIGDTPLLHIDNNFIKCEFLNPSGSLKARLAKYMIERAEKEGLIKPGDTIVESTSGNTGNAMSMVAAVKGYKMIVCMPKDFSKERAYISRAFGADVRFVGTFNVDEAMAESLRLGALPGHWCPQQFNNEWNVEENEKWMAEEILSQIPKGVTIDAVTNGIGTGGTLIGVGKVLKEKHNPNIKVVAMEPDGAALIKCGEFSHHLIEGISDGFVPGIIERHRDEIDDIVRVSGEDAVAKMKELARTYGTFVGPSSGANWLAADRIRKKHKDVKNVLTFFCDKGEKYLYDHFKNED